MCKCCNSTRNVIAVNVTPTLVTLTVDRTIPAGACFKLRLLSHGLVNINTAFVNVTDGITTYELRNCCSGDRLRYDSLARVVDCRKRCGAVVFDCRAGVDTSIPTVSIRFPFPESTYAVTAPTTTS